MQLPENSKAAAKIITLKAAEEGSSLSSYCLRRGMSPSIVYNWEVRDGGYDEDTFRKLIDVDMIQKVLQKRKPAK